MYSFKKDFEREITILETKTTGIREYSGMLNSLQVFFKYSCQNICKLVNVIHHINRLTDKNHMIISLDAEKTSDKHSFIIKVLEKLEIQEIYLK